MTTIGTAVLQIIPSLKGVSEAIEKQIDGKVVEVKVAPKVDQTAAKKAGQEAGATVAKEANAAADKTPIQPKVDKPAAKKAGQEAGDAVVKGTKEAVQKSGPGKDIAKVIVDGLADGVKQGLPRGGVAETIVDGLTDGVKQGIDRSNIGPELVGSIGDVFKRGNLSGTIKDAVLPGIKQIGTDLRSGSAEWVGGIANALRSGDIQGAVDDIANTVSTTTNKIADIGAAFGLQTDGIRQFGQDASGILNEAGGFVSTITETTESVKGIAEAFGLIGPAASGAGTASAAGLLPLSAALGPIALTAAGLLGTFTALKQQAANDAATQAEVDRLNADPNRINGPKAYIPPATSPLAPFPGYDRSGNKLPIVVPPSGPGAPTVFGGYDAAGKPINGPAAPAPSGNPLDSLLPGLVYDPLTGKWIPKKATGGMITGPGTAVSDSVLARLSNGEYVVNAAATRKNLPLLEMINAKGYAGGGLVAGDQQLADIIKQRFGISDIGGYRPADKYGEHSTGRALDVMVGKNKSQGDAVKDFALANASAIDLKWVIWRQHLFYPGGGGYDMPDRGSPTQNHMDHVHIFSGTGITNGLRGALQGGRAGGGAAPVSSGPGAIDPTSSDQTSSASAVSSSGSGVSLPSSFSGLSSFGLDSLGSGVGKTGSGSDLSSFGKAAGSAVSGQVSSALGVFGISDAPPFLKAATTLIGGLKVGGHDPSGVSDGSIFNGANPLGGFGQGSAGSSAAPLSSTSTTMGTPPPDDAGNVHGTRAGQPAGPGPVYNIRTATVEDAFLAAQRKEDERRAAKLSRF